MKNILYKSVAHVCFVLALISVLSSAAFSQAALSSITGSTRDATGSIVPGADVSITNTSKGIERKMTTNDLGLFNAPALLPASGYTVTVVKTGFATYEAKDLTLEVGQSLNLTVLLSVAATGSQVSVTGEAPVIEIDKTDVSSVVNSNQLLNLPINGRRVDSFVLLGAGVAPDAGFGLLTFRGNPGGNTFMTDGIDTTNSFWNENAGRTRTYNISQDAVQEFQIVTSNFLPEYGRASGGVVNTITRSGGNDIHGTLYWFFRNRTLNATDPTAHGVNPPEWRHQAGASIGGPIKKNKLFYFFNGELQRRNFPLISSNVSSTLFDSLGNPTATALSPLTGCGGSSFATRASSAQCQTALNFLQSRVQPQVVPRTSDVNLMFAKTDYQINDANRLTLQLNYLDFRSPNGIQTQGAFTDGSGIGANADSAVFSRTAKAGLTTIVTPTIVNEFRFGLFKDREADSASSSLYPVTGPASYSIATGSLNNIGSPTQYPRLLPSETRFQFSDTLSYNVNRHTFKFGVDIERTEDYVNQLKNQYGTFVFPNLNAFALDFSGNTTGSKNYTSYTQTFGNKIWDQSVQDFALFAQDEIRLTSKLTISPGVRVEHTTLPQPASANPDYPQTGVINYKPTNVAPRIGIAYAMNEKTVFRAGYGVFESRFVNQVLAGLFINNGSYQPNYSLTTPGQINSGGPTFPNYLATAPNVPGTANIAYTTPNFRNTYSEQFQASLQREIAKNTSVTVSYIWSRGLHLLSGYNANLGTPTSTQAYPILDNANTSVANQVGVFSTPFYTNALRINPNYSTVTALTSDANSYYNALLIQVNRKYTGWFQAQANYTWSHAIDSNIGGSSGNSGGAGVISVPTAPTSYANNDIGSEKGSSSNDQRHRLVINAIFSPKFTHGQSWIDRHVVNGWQISLVSTFASSFPIDSIIGGVSSATLPTGSNAFATSTINGLGGSIRVPFQPVGNLNTGQIYRTDARLAKDFKINERIKVQLGFEAQNVFNHLIVAGATPLNNQEYSLVKPSSGPYAGQSVLVPYANYLQLLQTQAPPDGTTARRAQASLRITF